MASCTSRLHGSASKKSLILWIKFLAFQWKLTWWCSSEMWLSNYTDNWHVTFFMCPSLLARLLLLHQVSLGIVTPHSSDRKKSIHIRMGKLQPMVTAGELFTLHSLVARCASQICIRMMEKLQVILESLISDCMGGAFLPKVWNSKINGSS